MASVDTVADSIMASVDTVADSVMASIDTVIVLLCCLSGRM